MEYFVCIRANTNARYYRVYLPSHDRSSRSTLSLTAIASQPQGPAISQAVEYVDTMKESRSGVTRYNQGLDGASLHNTAAGFEGVRSLSEMRVDLIAGLFAENGISCMFDKIIKTAQKFHKKKVKFKSVEGSEFVSPQAWKYNTNYTVEGVGTGNRRRRS